MNAARPWSARLPGSVRQHADVVAVDWPDARAGMQVDAVAAGKLGSYDSGRIVVTGVW
jgi:hypothetical protein